jgi:serine/threonine protein kinase/Flp pilus assembly protein TadD
MNRPQKQVSPAMNDDPTIPIGAATPAGQGERVGVPAAAAAWGNFTLLARVGHGGFGEVFRAWDPHLQREVALKLLLPGAVTREAEYEAMLREARALASVRHPNIVPVHGIDRHDGRVGFWTDFVRGKTLATLVAHQGTFGAREAALIGLDVARALSAVHRAGLLHRDIKAENVMREEGGRILLMDFGLSSLEQRQTNIAGTPNYMAPELFQDGKATVTSDIYAMGVLLYFLVAGDYPVHLGGLTLQECLDAFAGRKPLMDLRPDLPESLLRTVSTATDIDPAKRFQSAGQLANALAESLGTHAPVETSAPAPPRPPSRQGLKWAFTGLLTAAVLAAGSLVWYGSRQRPPHPANDSAALPGTAANDQLLKAQDELLHSYKESNLVDAAKGFESVFNSDPANALAEAQLGAAHFALYRVHSHDLKLLDQARQESDRASRLDPELAAPHITMARIEAQEGRTDLAMQEIQKARKIQPNSAEVQGAFGEVYEAQGKMKDAMDAYQKAMYLAPDDWRWPVNLGVAKFSHGDIAESISLLETGKEKAPDNSLVYFDLGVARSQFNQIDQALADVNQAIRIEPSDRAYSLLGTLLLYQGKFDQSIAAHKQAIHLGPNNYSAYANLAEAYRWSGANRDEAAKAYRQSIALEEAQRKENPRDPELLSTLAYSYAAIGDATRSIPLANQAIALAENDPRANFYAGISYEMLGKRTEAIPLLAKAIARGFHVNEFERDPALSGLRADPRFNEALAAEKSKKQ